MNYEKSIWPCFTPDMFWALSDEVRDIGRCKRGVGQTFEYDIDYDELPNGELGLWRFNGLRDIVVAIEEWPYEIRHLVKSATLCLDDKALETVTTKGENIQFTIFSKESILPIALLKSELLTVSILFEDAGTMPPRHAIHATGLFMQSKDRSMPKPFFIAGIQGAVVSWNGSEIVVNQSAGGDRTQRESVEPEPISDDMTYDALWKMLPLPQRDTERRIPPRPSLWAREVSED